MALWGRFNLFPLFEYILRDFLGCFVLLLLLFFSFYESYESTGDPSNQPEGPMGSLDAPLDPQDPLDAPRDTLGSLNITLLTPFGPY